jgi:hypothetical protein
LPPLRYGAEDADDHGKEVLAGDRVRALMARGSTSPVASGNELLVYDFRRRQAYTAGERSSSAARPTIHSMSAAARGATNRAGEFRVPGRYRRRCLMAAGSTWPRNLSNRVAIVDLASGPRRWCRRSRSASIRTDCVVAPNGKLVYVSNWGSPERLADRHGDQRGGRNDPRGRPSRTTSS